MKRIGKLLSILLVLSMLLTGMPLSVLAQSPLPFGDVGPNDWYYNAVSYVYEQGLMNGTGPDSFSPNVTTSRGMIVTILHSMEGYPVASGGSFIDVPVDAWYAKAVTWASGNGIVSGYGGGRFGPNDPITREQLAMILYRYAQFKGMNTEVRGDSASFADSGQISSYAVTAINWAVGFGLLGGVGNNRLSPEGSATRAQAAVMLTRFCTAEELQGTVPPTPTMAPTPTPTPTPAPTPAPTPVPTVKSGYAVAELGLEGSTVEAVVSAGEPCSLVVELRSEDDSTLITSFAAPVEGNTELETVTAALPAGTAVPEYFLLRAVLRSETGEQLCTPVTCRRYTQAYEKFSAQREKDFAPERVIDLVSADDGNFAVVHEDVLRLTQTADANVLQSRSEGVSVFAKADDTLRGLKKGDKLLLQSTDGQYAAVMIDSITVADDGTVTLREAANTTLADFYQVIKISTPLVGRPSAADGTVESPLYLAGDDNIKDREYLSEIEMGPAVSNTIETPFGSFGHSTSAGGKLEMNYDYVFMGKDYLEFVLLVGIKTELELEIGPNKAMEDEIKIVSIPLAGLKDIADIPAEISLAYEVDCSAGMQTGVSVEAVTGVVYNTYDGSQQVEYKEVAQGYTEIYGSVEIEVGLRASINAEVFDGKAKATLGAEGGVGISGEAKAFTAPLPDTDSYHACDLCVPGDTYGYFEVEIAAKYEICDWFKGDIIDLDLLRLEWHIGKFYFSLVNDVKSVHKGLPVFDEGECPNNKYKVNVVTCRNGKAEGGTAEITHSFWGQMHKADTPYVTYLYPASYTADAQIGIQTDTKSFTVGDSPETVKLEVKDPVLSGTVTDKETGDPIGGATVTLGEYSATAGSDGHYTVQVEPGDYTVTCTAEGYHSSSVDLQLLKNKTQSFVLEKKEGYGIVSGTVTDKQTGEALQGVTVSTKLPDGKAVTAATDSSGMYSLELLGGEEYTLTFTKSGYSEATAKAAPVVDETVTVNAVMEKTDERDIYIKYLLNGGYKSLFSYGEKKYAKIYTNYGDFDGNGIKDLLLYYSDTEYPGPRGYETYTVLYTIDPDSMQVVEVTRYYYGGGTMGGDYLTLYRKNPAGDPQLVIDSTMRDGMWKFSTGQVTLNYSGQTATEGKRVISHGYSLQDGSFYKGEIERMKQGIHYIDSDGNYLRVYTIDDVVVTKETFDAATYPGGGYVEGDEFFTYSGTYDVPIRPNE